MFRGFVIALAILLAPSAYAANVASVVIAPTGDKTGAKDTLNINTVCKAGKTANLEADATYYVTQVVCNRIDFQGANNEAYFWYQGQSPNQSIVGVGSVAPIICPSPGPCVYREFNVTPAAGAPGIGTNGTVQVMKLDNISVIDDNQTSTACVDLSAAPNNQELEIHHGTFIHCGGWCIEAGVTSDSYVDGGIIANCASGGLHVAYGYGWVIKPTKIEGMYSGPGIEFDNGGTTLIADIVFDQNVWDMSLGGLAGSGSGGQWYGNVSNIQDGRTNAGGVFDFEGTVAVVVDNVFTGGPNYYVNPALPAGSIFAMIRDINPSYRDPNSQAIISPFVNQ